MEMTQEMRVKKSHIAMMKHPATALYSGVMMMGTTEVVDGALTASTDGINKKYGRKFLSEVCGDDREVTGLVLHENLHIVLRHMIHNLDLFKEDRGTANKAADYVVNDMITDLAQKYPDLIKLPEGGLYDPQYHNMNMREVYRLLKEEQGKAPKQPPGDCKGPKPPQGEQDSPSGKGEDESEPEDGEGGDQPKDGKQPGGQPSEQYEFDEHGTGGIETAEDAKEIDARVDRALREGALLAGRLGVNIPRHITDILNPKVNWKEAFRDWLTSFAKGKDEYTWRRFNRRLLSNDLYMPAVEDETVGEIVIAIDTSGSIDAKQLNEFATELVSICDMTTPEVVRVIWWDTRVHGEQKFDSVSYSGIAKMLKPEGGGGTRVSCVPEYLNNHKINAECIVVFTDGYLESDINWNTQVPTLWMVTRNEYWVPPSGKKVFFSK